MACLRTIPTPSRILNSPMMGEAPKDIKRSIHQMCGWELACLGMHQRQFFLIRSVHRMWHGKRMENQPSHTMQRLVYVWWFIVKLFHLLSSLSSCYQNLEISISQHVTAVSARRSRWSKAVLEIAGWWLPLLLLLVTRSLSRSSSIPTIWQRMVSRHHYFSLPKINENQDLPTFLVVMSDVKDVSMFMDLRSGVLIPRQVCCFNVRCRDALMDSACHWWVHSMQTTKWKTCSSLRKTYGRRTMGGFARETQVELAQIFYGILVPLFGTKAQLFHYLVISDPAFFVFALVTSRKAFGKFVYSWGKLEGGDAWYAFQVMTGFKTCVAYTMRKNKWKKKTLKEDWAHGKTENARGRKINYKCVSPWCAVLLKLWASLQKAERNRHLSTVGETIFGQMPRFQLWLWAKRAGKVIWTEIYKLNLILFAAGLTSPKALIPKNWNDFKRKKLGSQILVAPPNAGCQRTLWGTSSLGYQRLPDVLQLPRCQCWSQGVEPWANLPLATWICLHKSRALDFFG